MLDAESISAIAAIVDSRLTKAEESIRKDVEKIATKLDELNNNHHDLSERVTRLEENMAVVTDSKKDQGERIGHLEQAIYGMQEANKARTAVKGGVSEWVRWIIPLGISALVGFVGWLVGANK